MYAVVAPGLKGIYEDPKVIDKIMALYPYTKFRKFQTEEECWAFLERYENNHGIEEIRDFGDTFDKHHVVMEYFIRNPNVYFNYDTSKLGTLRLVKDTAIIENRTNLIKAMIPNLIVDRVVCTPSSRQRNNLHFTHENPSCIPYGAGCYAASRRSWTSIGVRTPRPRWRRWKL